MNAFEIEREFGISLQEQFQMKVRSRCFVIAREMGMSVEEFRAKFHPELHRRILAKRAEALLPLPVFRGPVAWGFVYVFAAGELVKVGMSDAGVESRWQNIRCSNPLLEPPLYVSAPLGNRARQAEEAVHTRLATYHESGEWFRCDRSLAIDTVKAVEKEFVSA